MNRVCFGCGSILQSDSEMITGYVPKEKIDNANYCKRCFRLTHYGDKTSNDFEKSTKTILDKVNFSNNYKIFIIDFININNNTMNIFKSIKGNKLLLISKIDLIDKSININNVVKRIKEIYRISSDIRYISSVKDYGVNSLLKYLEIKNIKKCYILGPTNSGKSTLINKLMELYNPKLNKLTISNKRNTTLEFIKIKIKDITFIDSPGFLINDYNLDNKYKSIIKPITFNMKENEVIKINDFYIKFSNNTSITIYLFDKLEMGKYYKELEFNYDMEIDDNIDLCINGFGIINIKHGGNIRINNLDKDLISIRRSVFGGYDE
ncbi:MAG: 50S ribosome-binding GTPase [Bacilli bacterium]|nr:50S ribosome-binding GTPase [Bacilli bacterium]